MRLRLPTSGSGTSGSIQRGARAPHLLPAGATDARDARATPPSCLDRPRGLTRPPYMAGAARCASSGPRRKLGRPRDLDREHDRARRSLVHALHGDQSARGRVDPANRACCLGRSDQLGQASREPGARGRPALVRPARPSRWRDQSWRDPWLFRHPDDGSFHCLITARSPLGASDGAGVVGHARSLDLVGMGGASAGHPTGRLRAGRGTPAGSRRRLVSRCSSHARRTTTRGSGSKGSAPGETGTFVFASDEMFGPYAPPRAPRSPRRTARSARSTREAPPAAAGQRGSSWPSAETATATSSAS